MTELCEELLSVAHLELKQEVNLNSITPPKALL